MTTDLCVNALLFQKINHVEIGVVRIAPVGDDEVRVSTLLSTISPGTELRMLAGHYGATGQFPFVPGYSSVGEVVEVGSKAAGWRVGDRVSGRNARPPLDATALYGAHCALQNLSATGTQCPVLLPEGCDPLDYAFVELASISLRGVEAARPEKGETAVVIGQGLIGVLSAAWLATRGCRVAVADIDASRLELALRMGAAAAVNLSDGDALPRLHRFLNGGADIVVEASGVPRGVETALQLLRKKPQNYSSEYMVEPIGIYGADWPRLVFQANYLDKMPLNPTFMLPGEAALFISPRDRGIEERQRTIEAIRTGVLDTTPLRDCLFAAAEAPAAYEALKERRIVSAAIDWR
jgi:L-iditol 2-dehydrogenase